MSEKQPLGVDEFTRLYQDRLAKAEAAKLTEQALTRPEEAVSMDKFKSEEQIATLSKRHEELTKKYLDALDVGDEEMAEKYNEQCTDLMDQMTMLDPEITDDIREQIINKHLMNAQKKTGYDKNQIN